MSTLYPTISNNLIVPYGEENAVASFHLWITTIFGHDDGYPIYFDKDSAEFQNRELVKFPNINVQQIDTQDNVTGYIGGKSNKAGLLFYVYFNHHMQKGGTRRLLRRGRDQISYALKMAGNCDKSGNFYVNPIYFYDLSTGTPQRLNAVITVGSGIQQRFIQDADLLQYEFMVPLSYLEQLT